MALDVSQALTLIDSFKKSFEFLFQENKLTLERVVCAKSSPGSVVQSSHCIFKHISRTHLKIEFSWIFTRPVNGLWVRCVFYHKFNGITFQKFPIDLVEDVCGWMSGTTKSFIMEWTFGKLLKYSNFNHTCPYVGPMWVRVNSFPEDAFDFEQALLPSGKYRVENYFMESAVGDPFMNATLYFSVSDHRLQLV